MVFLPYASLFMNDLQIGGFGGGVLNCSYIFPHHRLPSYFTHCPKGEAGLGGGKRDVYLYRNTCSSPVYTPNVPLWHRDYFEQIILRNTDTGKAMKRVRVTHL